MSEIVSETIELGDARIHLTRWGSEPAELVMLHDGLGSVGQWRDVPARIALRTGRSVLAYDRPGHGTSTPIPEGPWPADWLRREADRLADLLPEVATDRPILVGHSDGASIALIHASATGDAIAGVVSLAAHSYVEPVCSMAIATMRNDPEPILDRLARHHQNPDAVFCAWSGVWTGTEFSRWDIRPLLGAISAPVLVVQGGADGYGTDAMALDTTAAIGSNAECRLLPGVGHLVHHEDPDIIVELVAELAAHTLD